VSAALLATVLLLWAAAVIASQFGFRPVPELPLVADGPSQPSIVEVDPARAAPKPDRVHLRWREPNTSDAAP
jgi:hypothetical protein